MNSLSHWNLGRGTEKDISSNNITIINYTDINFS